MLAEAESEAESLAAKVDIADSAQTRQTWLPSWTPRDVAAKLAEPSRRSRAGRTRVGRPAKLRGARDLRAESAALREELARTQQARDAALADARAHASSTGSRRGDADHWSR